MKKYLFIVASALCLLASCNKTDTVAPTIVWTGNEKFATQEINLTPGSTNAEITVTAQEGFDSFQISASLPSKLVVLGEKIISIAGNKVDGQPLVFDLLKDQSAASELAKMGFIKSTTITSPCTLDFNKLIVYLMENTNLASGSEFKFTISVTDKSGKSASPRVATFRWTSAPIITFNPAVTTSAYTLTEDANLKIAVQADGGIAHLTLAFGDKQNPGDPGIIAYVTKRVGQDPKVDLVDEAENAKKLGLASGSDVKGKKSVEIDLSSLLSNFFIETAKLGVVTPLYVTVDDALGKTVGASITMVKASN